MPAGTKRKTLDERLKEYAQTDAYPFHMPGHKRRLCGWMDPYAADITEIDGFDDLHAPEGALKEAMERAAALYGAKRSFYLVNGSTCGILAAIFAAVPRAGKLLMSRNAHKSAYHAAGLRLLKTEYLMPKIGGNGVCGAVSPKEVRRMLDRHPDADAVYVTSPTYEGIVSDIAEIAKLAHARRIPLIVDEAHGAHFGFCDAFPQTAARLGADLVIQSMHKTLPSLTQTALLHLDSAYVSESAVQKFLSVFQTSSPSYLLMGGMDRCACLLMEEGGRLFDSYSDLLDEFYRKSEAFSRIRVLRRSDFSDGEAFDFDKSKLVISLKHADLSGKRLYDILRDDYRLQMEAYSFDYVIGMTSILDGGEGMERLYRALLDIDRKTGKKKETGCDGPALMRRLYAPREKKLELWEAAERRTEEVSFEEAAGRISGCMAGIYPPGIPAIACGEVLDGDFIETARECIKFRLNLQGIADIIKEKATVAVE